MEHRRRCARRVLCLGVVRPRVRERRAGLRAFRGRPAQSVSDEDLGGRAEPLPGAHRPLRHRGRLGSGSGMAAVPDHLHVLPAPPRRAHLHPLQGAGALRRRALLHDAAPRLDLLRHGSGQLRQRGLLHRVHEGQPDRGRGAILPGRVVVGVQPLPGDDDGQLARHLPALGQVPRCLGVVLRRLHRLHVVDDDLSAHCGGVRADHLGHPRHEGAGERALRAAPPRLRPVLGAVLQTRGRRRERSP
mmetsp:Transcript_6096/g.17372  ORF Transcript_6096/g.17372 Transcript_6096/m.17372 type:complete len:245 (+) Transcript_6096:283-1017(+)